MTGDAPIPPEAISVFDMLKIGVGPSSSHTLGPWRAAEHFVQSLGDELFGVAHVRVELFGSLAKTGRGHGTGIATMMGLAGHDPVACDVDIVQQLGPQTRASGSLALGGRHEVDFVRERDIVFDPAVTLDQHPNGMRFTATFTSGATVSHTAFSIGGGFVVHGDVGEPSNTGSPVELPYAIGSAVDLTRWCRETGLDIASVVRHNERTWRDDAAIDEGLREIRDTMLACVFRGVSTRGILPGGLGVDRRAADLHDSLLGAAHRFASPDEWFAGLVAAGLGFDDTVRLISCLALAVNEENAAFGRVVTAPTNGAAGVIPAVLLHHLATVAEGSDLVAGAVANDVARRMDDVANRFLLVAAEIGSIFKKGATISAALGGCQAEIGVSSAMAAAALTDALGATVEQSLMAAEIAMEHHLGLTCDPIGGLVQVPCIERNAMGAMKAIAASQLARAGQPERARVSLDDVIETMWATAQDMNHKYKETAEGGLAVRIPVSVVEC
ncbi:MAG: L-serine ammonia-lyase [Ilumatobacter sp.]